MKNITINVPSNVCNADWLRDQLRILVSGLSGEWGNIDWFDDAEDGYNTPEAFLLAVDEGPFVDCFDIKARVIFHKDGTAYIDPSGGIDEDPGSACMHEDDHVNTWVKGNWADGLVALAKSITGRLVLPDDRAGRQISEALLQFVKAVRQTKVELPRLETE